MIKYLAHSLCILALLSFVVLAQEPNWNQFRGPNSDNHSASTGIAKSWGVEGPNLLWKIDTIGLGYAGISFFGDMMFTMGDIGDQCYVIAMDRNTGGEIWKKPVGRSGTGIAVGGRQAANNSVGPLSTPACDGETVYVYGQYSDFVAYNMKDGKELWRTNTVAELGGNIMSNWAISPSPILDGDKILLPIGGDGGILGAFDKTGKLLWRSTEIKDAMSYASAVPVEIAGVRQYLVLTGGTGVTGSGRGGPGGGPGSGGRARAGGGQGAPPAFALDPDANCKLVGISATDGKVLWQAPFRGQRAIASDPVLCGDVVMAGCGYGVGADFYRITKSGNEFKAEKFLEDESLLAHHGGIVAVKDHFYLLSDRKGLTCIEAKTGKIVWENRSVGKGSLTYADGVLFLRSEGGDGTVAMVEATPERYKELGKFNQPYRSEKNSWTYPAVMDKKLYLRDQGVLLCYALD